MNPLTELRYFFTALGYFTRVPVPRWVGYEPHYLNAAARYFPLVGVLVGGVGALVYLAALRVFPPGVAVLLSMAATLLVTGAFHEDGLADCCDAFGGAYTREDVLRIMHDSRIGAFGAIALVIALALKWQTLAALPPLRAAGLMIAAHAASRTFAISYLATLDYVRAEGKAKPVAQRLSGRGVRVGGVVRAAVAVLAGLALRLCVRLLMFGSTALCTGPLFRQTHRWLYRRLPRLRATDFRTGHLSGWGLHGSRPDSSSGRRGRCGRVLWP